MKLVARAFRSVFKNIKNLRRHNNSSEDGEVAHNLFLFRLFNHIVTKVAVALKRSGVKRAVLHNSVALNLFNAY